MIFGLLIAFAVSAVNVSMQAQEPTQDGGVKSDEGVADGLREPDWLDSAVPAERLQVPKGFRAELVYSVPRESQGSWVCLVVDPLGDLIASDQDGYLYRIHVAKKDLDGNGTRVTRLKVKIGMCQGMTFLGDRLYTVVNGRGIGGHGSGLYCLDDLDRDGEFESLRLLREFDGEGEHGPHAVVPSPDGKWLYVLAGNHTKLTEVDRSMISRRWGEDQLLRRLWDASGHAVGILAPGGWICRTDLDGKHWELVSIGFRNPYDIAFNVHGDLFTFDSDMEWDIGTPWYRPTRLCHVPNGSEFGWRSGSGKWPEYFPDSLPPTADLGPGSPSGITFGYATSFPPEYRNNLFMCDWSFGRIYAAALRPQGASYRADVREFVTGTPLPVTDIVANPSDGALYFAIGGRRTQSALYRVVYTGPPTDSSGREELPGEAKLRRSLEEELHGSAEAQQIDRAWPHLRHADRFVRFTARTVIEAGPIAIWQERALREQDPWGRIEALVAWARCSDSPDANLWNAATARLLELDWTALAPGQRLSALRAIELILIRGGSATKTSRAELLRHLCSLLPTEDIQLRRRVAFLRSFLGDTQAIHGMLQEMETASTQEEQIAFAYGLRQLIGKGTLDEQRRYFQWYLDSHDLHGGSSLRGFLDLIRGDSVSELGEEALGELADLIATPIVEETTTPTTSSLPLIKQYSIQDVVIAGAKFDRSATLTEARAAFSKGLCFRCHRVGLEGGSTGPDLTTAHRRFSRAYIAESLVVPDSEVSDRYRSSSFVLKNGKTISGRVANMSVNDIRVVTDMLRPGDFAKIERKDIAEIRPQARSEMPSGLLDGLTEKEIGAIFAYLDSEGNPDSPVFQNELK